MNLLSHLSPISTFNTVRFGRNARVDMSFATFPPQTFFSRFWRRSTGNCWSDRENFSWVVKSQISCFINHTESWLNVLFYLTQRFTNNKRISLIYNQVYCNQFDSFLYFCFLYKEASIYLNTRLLFQFLIYFWW